MVPIWFLYFKKNTLDIRTTMKLKFTVWKCMLGWCIRTQFSRVHVRCCYIDTTPMRYHRVCISLKKTISRFTVPSVLCILTYVSEILQIMITL